MRKSFRRFSRLAKPNISRPRSGHIAFGKAEYIALAKPTYRVREADSRAPAMPFFENKNLLFENVFF